MPGDEWQRFANLRCLLAFQWFFPGKQLLMMSCEIGQHAEWSVNTNIDWWLLDEGPYHRGIQRLVRDLNRVYQNEPALWEADYDFNGFFWIDCGDADNSVLSFARRNKDGSRCVAVILNLTPVLRPNYRIGLPQGGFWREVMNTDSGFYAGSNQGNFGGVQAEEYKTHHQPFSAVFTLPPLSVIAFRLDPPAQA
jgi:1,4-alpha-glucan branching enzyme